MAVRAAVAQGAAAMVGAVQVGAAMGVEATVGAGAAAATAEVATGVVEQAAAMAAGARAAAVTAAAEAAAAKAVVPVGGLVVARVAKVARAAWVVEVRRGRYRLQRAAHDRHLGQQQRKWPPRSHCSVGRRAEHHAQPVRR